MSHESPDKPARKAQTNHPFASLTAFLVLATLYWGQCGRCMGEHPSAPPTSSSAAPTE